MPALGTGTLPLCSLAAWPRRTSGLDFDPEAVRERYRDERDKRLRDNGADQYIEMAGEFAPLRRG